MSLTAEDLAEALSAPGLINEDIVQTVYNLDEGIPTVFCDLVGMGGVYKSPFSEWTEDNLRPTNKDNARPDGAPVGPNRAKRGNRVGVWGQISDGAVEISHRSQGVSSVGNVGSMAYQTAQELLGIRRDIEAIATGRQGSRAPVAADLENPDGVASLTAGLAAWLKTNIDKAGDATAGGYDLNTKLVDAPVAGTKRGLEWETVRNVLEMIYNGGGNPSHLMSVPSVIKRINSFLFSDAGKPYRADPTANVTGTGGGATQTAQGYISVVLSDFGITMNLVDNRLQDPYDSLGGGSEDAADVFLVDPAHFELATLEGFRNDEIGKKGHSDERMLSVDWKTRCLREDAHGMISDIDVTAAVTAGTP